MDETAIGLVKKNILVGHNLLAQVTQPGQL